MSPCFESNKNLWDFIYINLLVFNKVQFSIENLMLCFEVQVSFYIKFHQVTLTFAEQISTSRKVLKVAQWKDANGSWKLDVSNSFVLGQTMYDDWLMTDWWFLSHSKWSQCSNEILGRSVGLQKKITGTNFVRTHKKI